MKTVINALQYKKDSSGIGVMVRELMGRYARLAPDSCQVVLPEDAPDFPSGGAEQVRAPLKHGQGLKRMFFQLFLLGRKYCRDAVLLTTDSKIPFFLPKSCVPVTVVTDMAVYRMPEVYQRSRVLLWRMQYAYLRRRARFYTAISEFTKSELAEILKIPPEKIYIVPCAVGDNMRPVTEPAALAALREKYGLPEKYVLFVGNNNPRKNLERTICAFDMLKERTELPHVLVIAGEQGWKFDRAKALEGIKNADKVIFTGFVPDEDVPALYSAASLFVFPTLYEGFGIPVIEAQRCMTPVLTGNVSALPDTAGEGAAYADPYDTQSICEGMRAVLEDGEYAQRLVRLGLENAKRFSWDKSARLLREIIEKETGK